MLESVVNFTKDEKADNIALVVESEFWAVTSSRTSTLKEKDRFSGRYEGYVRLTDPNGDGNSADKDDPKTTGIDESKPTDWGRQIGDATSEEKDGAAVLAVSGSTVTSLLHGHRR